MFKSLSLLATAACLALAQPATDNDGVRGNLASVGWLEKNLTSPDVLVLDASLAPAYAEKHIPGAINVDLFTYGLPDLSIPDMEKRFQSWGVTPGKKIVLYDQGGSMMATRVFFSLLYYGFPVQDLLILDGGLSLWEAHHLPVTKDKPSRVRPGSFQVHALNADVRADLPEFLTASGDTAHNALLEALGADWHFGQVLAFDRAGHIPNGILLPSADFYNSDKTFKSAEAIGKMLTYLGVKPEQQIYTYCGGGVAASVPFFALKFLLRYPRVKLFTDSELGWLSDPRELPYWTYDDPSLMRNANWLQFWAGPRVRSIGLARVSVLDVRPAARYDAGHVPFAVNIPADVFRSHLGDPGKLADLLGSAGVNATHEAIVISDAGLTKDSALALLMLEKLGQRKVSVLMDSMDRWAQLGFTVAKDASATGQQKYPADVRKDVIIADPKGTQGVYPKVFVAAGAQLSSKAQDGKVVHVPYMELLNPDGTPKAAKDIWNILVKAGVPRYAELICYSDDPGEAAVDYFVLKLMGYPDIKVLVI